MQATATLFLIPTPGMIDRLREGDLAIDCFGRLARVTSVAAKGVDIEGRPFAVYYTRLGDGAEVSGSMKAGRLVRTLPVTGLFQSADLDRIERMGGAGLAAAAMGRL